jgi:hypothetical protein
MKCGGKQSGREEKLPALGWSRPYLRPFTQVFFVPCRRFALVSCIPCRRLAPASSSDGPCPGFPLPPVLLSGSFSSPAPAFPPGLFLTLPALRAGLFPAPGRACATIRNRVKSWLTKRCPPCATTRPPDRPSPRVEFLTSPAPDPAAGSRPRRAPTCRMQTTSARRASRHDHAPCAIFRTLSFGSPRWNPFVPSGTFVTSLPG